MSEFYENNSIIANNLRELRKYGNVSKKLSAWMYQTTVYFINRWESGKGKIPKRVIEVSAVRAMCSVEEFVSKEQTLDEITRRNRIFEAKSTGEIMKKYRMN